MDQQKQESLGRIVITGAAGRVGSTLREALAFDSERLVLVDSEPMHARGENETIVKADLADAAALHAAFEGAQAVVHLAGLCEEAPLPTLLDANVLGTQRVLEGVRRAGVPRVVLASSSSVTGHYPIHHQVFPDEPARPAGFHGVSKVAVEALGQLYADTFGLRIVALRLGSFAEKPSETRHLATWLSPTDCVGFVRAALRAPGAGFVALYAVSANARRFWDISAGEAELGYRPVDDSARYASGFADDDPFWQGGPQSGHRADPEALRAYLEG